MHMSDTKSMTSDIMSSMPTPFSETLFCGILNVILSLYAQLSQASHVNPKQKNTCEDRAFFINTCSSCGLNPINALEYNENP